MENEIGKDGWKKRMGRMDGKEGSEKRKRNEWKMEWEKRMVNGWQNGKEEMNG